MPVSVALSSRAYHRGIADLRFRRGWQLARQPERDLGQETELLALFVRNQSKVAMALPVLAVLFTVTNLIWVDWRAVTIWLASVLGSQAVQLSLCRHYEASDQRLTRPGEWVGMLAASELLFASSWSLPLFLFWSHGNELQHIYLIATLMTVAAIRIMIAGNFLPVVVAGTGFITLVILIRCLTAQGPLYVALGAMAVMTAVFFIQLSRRLEETARDILAYRSQREKLIGELERARDQAERDRKRAEEASRAKSRFLATMSHELRTPLNAIMGFSEILSQEMMGPHAITAYKAYSADIHSSGHYLLTLIDDILDLSRIEAGRQELAEEAVDIAAVASECAKLFQAKADERRQSLLFNIPADCPRLIGDRRAVRQILFNLVSNAIKFTPPEGKIIVMAGVDGGERLILSVKDTGPGIPAHEIEAALAAFARGSLATRRAIDGAGLGLPIVKGLVKLHEGELAIRSIDGAGTIASVIFPRRRVLIGAALGASESSAIASETQRRLIALTA
jgi:two-component system cell cycle sensor histidine kinase PleC